MIGCEEGCGKALIGYIDQQMNRQQAINKYVELIKREERRKKSNKLPKPSTHPHPLLPLAHLLENAMFKQSVQQKIKKKLRDLKQESPPRKPTLKTLLIDPTMKTQMHKTKRKFHLYQEQMEKKRTEDKGAQEQRRHKQQPLRPNKHQFLEPQQFHHLNQTHSLLFSRSPEHPLRFTDHRQPHKSDQQSPMKKIAELDGSIFHFEQSPSLKPFYRNMFYNKDTPEQAQVYEMLKTTTPFIIKSKVMAKELADNHSIDLRAQLLSHAANHGHPSAGRKKGANSRGMLHKRERSSLINLRVTNEEITAWELTEG